MRVVLLLLFLFVASTYSTRVDNAQTFVESLAIATHFDYDNTAYGNFTYIAGLLGELGVKVIRDGSNRDYVWDYLNGTLYTQYGIKYIGVFWPASYWSLNDMTGYISKYVHLMACVEGPNEPDVSGIDPYKNLTGVAAVKAFQADLYDAVKSSPITKNVPVASFPLAFTSNAPKFAPELNEDLISMHSYPGGQLPSDQLSTKWIPGAEQLVGNNPEKPYMATETGYTTDIENGCNTGQPGVSEIAQAKYLPRIYAEYWRYNFTLVGFYELHDESDSPCWGIVRGNKTRKPAFYSLKSFFSLISDPDPSAPSYVPTQIPLSINSSVSSVHYNLFQKASGNYYLMIWNEILVFDTKTKTDITNDPVFVIVNSGVSSLSNVTANTISGTGDISSQVLMAKSGVFGVNVTDTITVVELQM